MSSEEMSGDPEAASAAPEPCSSSQQQRETPTSPLFASDRTDNGDFCFKRPQDRSITTPTAADEKQSCPSYESDYSDSEVQVVGLTLGLDEVEKEGISKILRDRGDRLPLSSRSHEKSNHNPENHADTLQPQHVSDNFLKEIQQKYGPHKKTTSQPELFTFTRKKQTVRRNTDGALDKYNLHIATASASASIQEQERRRRSLNMSSTLTINGRASQSSLQEAPSLDPVPWYWTRFFGLLESTVIFSPVRRYNQRTSAIKVMDDQFFVPPPSDGVTFIGTVVNTLRGFGVDFVIWVNQSSFLTAFILFLSTYYAFVCLFAGILVYLEKKTDGKCLDLEEGWSTQQQYELSFELSWTTFTTVGYGQISPSGEEYGCYPMRVLCASFAFMGLLFNSLSAAVFFSKLESFLTRSKVTFSSSICLQFGTGQTRRSSHYGQFLKRTERKRKSTSLLFSPDSTHSFASVLEDQDAAAMQDKKANLVLQAASISRKLPYPILEIRIVNEHANYKNREIRNAHVKAMVQMTPADAENIMDEKSSVTQLLREYVTPAPRQLSSPASDEIDGSRNSSSSHTSDIINKANPRLALQRLNSSFLSIPHTGEGEDTPVEGRVYIPLTLEPPYHPYFKRVYYIHHVLNSKSPLLKPEVRLKIKNGWDPSLSTYQDIRDSLVDFRRIRIIFKGNSAVNNSMVFAEKVYTLDDLFIGWQFGNIFYNKKQYRWKWQRKSNRRNDPNDEEEESDSYEDDDDLMLDKRLIHDIYPQKNVSYEPLM